METRKVVLMKRKWQKFVTRIKQDWKEMRKDPKRYWITVFTGIREWIRNNTLFFTFVVSSVFNALLLRFFTIHTMENFFSLQPLLADFAICMLVGSFCYLLKPKSRFPYLLVVSIIFTAICIINSIYYTFYHSFTSISFLMTSRYVIDVGNAVVKNVMHFTDWIYLWAPIALILVYYRLKKNETFYTEEGKKEERNRGKFKSTLFVALGAALAFCITLTSVEVGRFASLWNREYVVMNFGIYTYHINDLFQSVGPQLTSLFGYDNAMKTFNDYYENVPDTQDYTNQYTGIFEGKNVIVIHAESMQQFVMNLSFNGEELTPNLNKLASESIFFDNFYSQVSVGTSSDTEFTFNTSLMPTNIGTVFVNYFDREYVTIPKLMKEKGYYTFSMHANKASYWNRDVMHKNLGYDRFYSQEDYVIDDWIGLGLSDKSFFRQSVEKMKEIKAQGQPYYGVLLMLTNHTPFDQVDKYGEYDVDIKETVTNEDGTTEVISHPFMEGTKLGDYFKSVHYADEALGEFLQQMEEEGLLENTVIVLYGDHDARLPIEDYVRLYNYDIETDTVRSEDDPEYIDFDEYQYELNRKVPFLIWSQETKEDLHTTVDTVMGMYDAMPTLGNMLGFYNKYQLGTDIFQTNGENLVVFPSTGNWLSDKVYYNAQKNEYLPLKESIITSDYVTEKTEEANEILNVSKSLIVFDLIRKSETLENQESEYIDEREIQK